MLGFLGAIGVELCLLGPQRIPFTCSYLPGKSNFQMAFGACIGLAFIIVTQGVVFEVRALHDLRSFTAAAITLCSLAVIALWLTEALGASSEPQFESLPNPAVMIWDLHQGGVPSVPSGVIQ